VPSLERANSVLKEALGEACAADVDRVDTGELIRIEEVLAMATDAAKQAISLRRRSRSDGISDQPPETPPDAGPSREFTDRSGVHWTAFDVHPSAADARTSIREQYRNGWLTFDSNAETRRIAPVPQDWRTMSDDQLVSLCERAEPARRRPSIRGGDSQPGP